MGILTTKTLTRKQAVSIIAGKIFTANNGQLEKMLDAVHSDGYSNFVIVDELFPDDESLKIDSNRKDIYD